MKSELRKIAKTVYAPTQSLFDFLTMCELFTDTGSVCQLGGVLKDDEVLALINWWKNKQHLQTYTIQVIPGNRGYLNLDQEDGKVSVQDCVWTPTIKTGFTKLEIEQLKQRDDLAIDWDKAKIEPVEDDE